MPEAGLKSRLVEELAAFIEAASLTAGNSTAINPGHRQAFHWPPPSPSYRYHLPKSAWSSSACFSAHGEEFFVEVAETKYGVFGRSPSTWHEARGKDVAEMLKNLKAAAEPLFRRQVLIATTIGKSGRFTGSLSQLEPIDLIKLLYCPDRDVANDAHIEIETHASWHIFGPALIEIIRDRKHPNRRSAQWCVLDLFEDLDSFCDTPEMREEAVRAIRDLIWDAEDDYARTVFKAGVVLGGHMPAEIGGPVLLECLNTPSKVGRRSAIHGLFHVVEWEPSMKDTISQALAECGARESHPQLCDFALQMARDIAAGNYDHVQEPMFPEELVQR
ncbi:MAG: hypothetical protein ABL949_04300 [Fimbriimonadaceae bacterium]